MKTALKTKKRPEWQLQEAKAMLSMVIKAADSSAQIITVRGEKTAVILSYNEYRKLKSPRKTFSKFIQESPLYDTTLELPKRQPEKMRDVYL